MASKKITKLPRKHFNVWTAYLLKVGTSAKEDCLSDTALKSVSDHSVELEGSIVGRLYVKDSSTKPPLWVKHFKSAFPPIKASSKSAAAVMLVNVSDRTFAVCFGHGRQMLRTETWEHDFGLKVVLNTIDSDQVRQINVSGFDTLLQNKQAQAVRNSPIDAFSLDVEQDVLKSLSGVPKDIARARNVDGRDSYRISTEVELQSLPTLLITALKDSQKKDYEASFPWIGRMKEVRDKSLVEKLDSRLIARSLLNYLELASVSWVSGGLRRCIGFPGAGLVGYSPCLGG